MDSRLEGLPAIPASSWVSRLTSHHIMPTFPSSLSSPSRYKRQNSDSIQFTSYHAHCAHESSKFNFLAANSWQKLFLVTNSIFRSLHTATFNSSCFLHVHVCTHIHIQTHSHIYVHVHTHNPPNTQSHTFKHALCMHVHTCVLFHKQVQVRDDHHSHHSRQCRKVKGTSRFEVPLQLERREGGREGGRERERERERVSDGGRSD